MDITKKALPVTRGDKIIGYMIECPACKCSHGFWTNLPNSKSNWTFVNNDLEKPTFYPSMLVYANKTGDQKRCHSFVKEGKIQYLDDCEHDMRGQTVELPDI